MCQLATKLTGQLSQMNRRQPSCSRCLWRCLPPCWCAPRVRICTPRTPDPRSLMEMDPSHAHGFGAISPSPVVGWPVSKTAETWGGQYQQKRTGQLSQMSRRQPSCSRSPWRRLPPFWCGPGGWICTPRTPDPRSWTEMDCSYGSGAIVYPTCVCVSSCGGAFLPCGNLGCKIPGRKELAGKLLEAT